jgi:hypothetical protein
VASTGEEHALLGIQEAAGAGIYGCEEWKVIDSAPSSGIGGSLTSSWTNVDPFIGAWRGVQGDGRWAAHPWTVKADPDCAFFPGLLRDRLSGQEPGGAGAYVSNCGGVSDGFYGALEVMSKAAVETYLREIDSCKGDITDTAGMGEDLFAQRCMNMRGVSVWEWGDMVCNADCGCDPHPCSSGRIAYHKFKDAASMQNCINEALR